MAALLALGRERTQHPPETLSAPVFAHGFKLLMFPSSVGLLDTALLSENKLFPAVYRSERETIASEFQM